MSFNHHNEPQIIIDGRVVDVTELVKRYHQLDRRLTQTEQRVAQLQEQLAALQRRSGATDAPASQEELIDRYYRVVEAVLGDYRTQVTTLQWQLTACLSGNGQTEFLQLAAHTMSPSSYQKMFLERNQQLVRYQHQTEADSHDELDGVRYWGNLVDQYRDVLTRLLEKNHNVHRDFRHAYHYAKSTVQRIRERKPAYLSDQNVMDLRTIYGGIKDAAAYHDELKRFYNQAGLTLKGVAGERLVKSVVKADANSRVLTSLNLPYAYHNGTENSNQIDCIVVNQKGIFVLEIKNYTADTIGIDQDGRIVTERGGRTFRGSRIARQGQFHYNAVLDALAADEEVKPALKYLRRQLHVLYISANPQTKIMPVLPGANHHYRFLSPAGLRQYIDETNGQLRPALVQAVVEAIDNRQQAEKTYEYLCFPADPAKRARLAWQQYRVMSKLLKLRLDDFVDRRDPDVRQKLAKAGLRTCDGYVTSKPH